MKKLLTKLFPLLPIVMFLTFFTVACDSKTDLVYKKEQQHTVDNQDNLNTVQPPTTLKWSLEREQINRRTNLWNDPNKISYFYGINYGKIMCFYVVKGKVTSVNSQVTNTQQVIFATNGNVAIPSPAEDGSYGTNGDAVFFFTTDGTYVEWKGDYQLSDKPLKMATPPELVREIQ